MELEDDNNTNYNRCSEQSPKELVKRLEDLKIREQVETIIKIGQNTKKCPGDLMRLAVTQTPMKKPAKAGVKNSQRSILDADKWKWKTRFEKNISGELENYSRQNSPVETSSKE